MSSTTKLFRISVKKNHGNLKVPPASLPFNKKILKVANSLGCMFQNKNTWLFFFVFFGGFLIKCVKYNVLQPTSKGIIISHEIQVINQQPSILHGWSLGRSM